MTQPAYVQGSEKQAIAVFDEDERGNLVDIRYFCDFDGCYEAEVKAGRLEDPNEGNPSLACLPIQPRL